MHTIGSLISLLSSMGTSNPRLVYRVVHETFEAFKDPVIGEVQRDCIDDTIDSPCFRDYVNGLNKCASVILGIKMPLETMSDRTKDRVLTSFVLSQARIVDNWYEQFNKDRPYKPKDPFFSYLKEVHDYVKMLKEEEKYGQT